jgi:hypothetical protein
MNTILHKNSTISLFISNVEHYNSYRYIHIDILAIVTKNKSKLSCCFTLYLLNDEKRDFNENFIILKKTSK